MNAARQSRNLCLDFSEEGCQENLFVLDYQWWTSFSCLPSVSSTKMEEVTSEVS